MNEEDINNGINDLLNKGYIEMVGLNKNGQVLYRVTEKGKEYATKMEKIIKEEEHGD